MALRNSLVPKRAPSDLKIPYQLRNGSINLLEKQGKFVDEHNQPLIISLSETKFLHSDDTKIFENLITITDAAKLSVYEVVPRFHKRPSDVVLEGSNNALIVLGTDRSSRLGNYFLTESKNKAKTESIGLSAAKTETDFRHYAGSIDMVVGRGYSLNTGGQSVDVTSISNNKDVIKTELDKFNLSPEEGNHDFTNDRSRILISQKTSTDINFNLSNYFNNKNFPSAPKDILDSPRGDSSIVIKSDKIRLIARSDISFIVTNFDDAMLEREKKEKYKNESDDKTKWASITIRRNGDIIFSPSDKGVIKLGGDDADKAILCTDNLAAKPINNEGTVTFTPGIISTGADLIGTGSPKQGTFATKILVK
jgi:hypothetical protein